MQHRGNSWRDRLADRSPLPDLLPVFLLVAISFAALFILLMHLTSAQDDLQHSREIDAVQSSIEEAVQLADRDLRDYAFWDDAARHLRIKFDHGWAENNLGPYLGGEQDYDHVLVIAEDRKPLYAFSRRHQKVELAIGKDIGAAFEHSLVEVLAADPGAKVLISGFSKADGGIYLFAVASVVPLTNRVQIPADRRVAIAIARRVTDENAPWRDKTRNSISLKSLPGGPIAAAVLPLRAPSGEALALLRWEPERPGKTLRGRLWPAFIAIAFIFLCLSGLIVRRGRKAVQAIHASQLETQALALHDSLTGLPNRHAIRQLVTTSLDAGDQAALLVIDLDGFKSINDVYGHSAGDELLKAVARRFAEPVGDEGVIARLGGDEFAVLVSSEAVARSIGKRLLDASSKPVSLRGITVYLGCSIGLAESCGAMDEDELFRRADIAMYAAKARGKHRLVSYDPILDAERDSRRALEEHLRWAIERHEIGVMFQPIIDARTQQYVGVEALARWTHPTLGVVPPDEFISIAEQSGLIISLGRQVLTSACSLARNWDLDLAVNLSPAQFWEGSLVTSIKEVLQVTGFPANRLELEITEGYLMKHPEAARTVLDELRTLGVKIALDDFGTGFASIGYLQRLGFDRLKIDKSIVGTFGPSSDLVRAIVLLGKALDLQVTAEGVESETQAVLLRAAGCDRLQGWYFGRPVSAEGIDKHCSGQLRKSA